MIMGKESMGIGCLFHCSYYCYIIDMYKSMRIVMVLCTILYVFELEERRELISKN
jgi:DNA repair photolyase